MNFFESFLMAHARAGLTRYKDLEDDFETYMMTGVPFADFEDHSGSIEWVMDWQKAQGLERTYESKGMLERVYE